MDKQSQFQASFSALVKCLQQGFQKGGIVSLPADIVKPFRQPFTPTESSSLRDLQKALENGQPKNINRLDSQSFYVVTSVVLQFPYSETQSKLLYLFMDTIRRYKDEHTLAPVLSLARATTISPAEAKEQGDYIGRKLGTCILRHLLAQFLSVLLRSSSVVANQIMETDESPYLETILATGESYFLRILIADVVRELLFNGAEREPLKKSCNRRSIVDDFPLSKNGDSMWLSKIVDHLSAHDVARASVGRSERIFRVQRLECDGNEYFDCPSPFIATVSHDISLLVPNGQDMLTLFSVPVSKNISLNHQTSESESSTVLEIRYPGIEGDKHINGSKGAINSLTITLCDKDTVEDFIQMIEEQRCDNTLLGLPSVPRSPKRHSVAFIELGSASTGGNHEKRARWNASTIPEADASSPLHNISLRAQQKQDLTATSTRQDHASKFESSASSSDKSAEDTPASRRLPETEPLIERLRASQEGPKGVQSKDKVSPAQPQLGHKNLDADVAQGALGKKPSPYPPSDATEPAPQAEPLDPDRHSLANKSDHRYNAEVVKKTTATSSRDGLGFSGVDHRHWGINQILESTPKNPRHDVPMANLVGIQLDPGGHSQASKSSAKAGLKRRSVKNSTAPQKPQPQKPSKSASDAAEFDLPTFVEEGTRPTKKARTNNPKAPTKASAKETAGTNGRARNAQAAVSPKRHKHKAIGKKLTKAPEKKTRATAASTRARRAAITPKYIELSDEGGEGGAGDAEEEEEEPANHGIRDNIECAEDSLPLTKGALEIALKASQHSSESNIEEIIDGDNTDMDDVPTEVSPARDSPDEQVAPSRNSVIPSTSHKQSPASRKHVLDPPFAVAVSEDNHDPKRISQQKSTPRHGQKRLSENSIPPVSEKLLRKTRIVHFRPQGPENQAVLQKTRLAPIDPETINETSRRPEHPARIQSEPAEDVDERVLDHTPEPMPRAVELEEASSMRHGIDMSERSAGGRDMDMNTHADNADEQAIELYGEWRTDISCDQEASEYIVSGLEEAVSEDSFHIPDSRSSHKTDTQRTKLRMPPVSDAELPCDTAGAKQPHISPEPTRQSIGVSSLMDHLYPQTEKVIKASKLHASHRAMAIKEVSRSHATPKVAPKKVIGSRKSEPILVSDDADMVRIDNTAVDIVPVPVLRAVAVGEDNTYYKTISPRQEHLRATPQSERESSASLKHCAAEPMGLPPPPTAPLRSNKQHYPLRKSWPAAQADRKPALLEKAVDETHKPLATGPVRVKKNLSLPLASHQPMLEPELSPATPVSFSSRLNLHLPLPDSESLKKTNGEETDRKIGNGSLTLVDGDETGLRDRSGQGPRLGRRQPSESRDDSSEITSPLPKTKDVRGGDSMVGVISARESQQEILDAIINITNDVLFRFGAEEDAIHAKVDEYDRGGNKVVHTLTDTWDHRLDHERRILVDVLEAENGVLTSALQLVKDEEKSGGAWKETVYDQELTGKVQEKRDNLVRKIEKLRKRG
ncbi:hypothetical protein AYL99_10581 [Fonsecaea erecta]|uniref:Uncharacterized protein n=1 Tax=Fonsecaea erecta TaxID=1367422 RepID=A0A178Z5T2_9EURO|nr:hypothetical protein AYL99_10581 [Fonsecaea erecta]OAP54881.1 hypothetical protein AYL99_10581 [Fonsecaea erecta]